VSIDFALHAIIPRVPLDLWGNGFHGNHLPPTKPITLPPTTNQRLPNLSESLPKRSVLTGAETLQIIENKDEFPLGPDSMVSYGFGTAVDRKWLTDVCTDEADNGSCKGKPPKSTDDSKTSRSNTGHDTDTSEIRSWDLIIFVCERRRILDVLELFCFFFREASLMTVDMGQGRHGRRLAVKLSTQVPQANRRVLFWGKDHVWFHGAYIINELHPAATRCLPQFPIGK
jgi:hypothetical protein